MYPLRASVRTRDLFLEIRGFVPSFLLQVLRREYGKRLIIRFPYMGRYRDALHAPLHQNDPPEHSGAAFLRYYRQEAGLTQAALGRLLGAVTRNDVCAMERGRRTVSRRMAVRLARVFRVSPLRFLG